MSQRRIAIVGGGAAGYFGAIACAEALPPGSGHSVLLLEATAHPLAKVRISGGGRCNTTHSCFDPRELVKRYPRGARELIGPFHQFQPRDTIAWFEARGVTLKTEPDGRMFPITDDSATIVECLERAAARSGVEVRTRCGVADAERSPDKRFELSLTNGTKETVDAVLLATGGNRSSAGLAIAQKFGHSIEPLAPSLFTFHVTDPRLADLAGIAVADTQVRVLGARLVERGPTLITHWGLSGPAILRLSAWGARELQTREYRFALGMNWAGDRPLETVKSELLAQRTAHPKRQIANSGLFGIPQRLWERLCAAAGLKVDAIWTGASNAALTELAKQIAAAEFAVTGKSMNKDEFVTCGGVRLSEVDFKTMQSRKCPGLFFAGELLDIDGITGGFNFQAAWTTGYLAGRAMAGISL